MDDWSWRWSWSDQKLATNEGWFFWSFASNISDDELLRRAVVFGHTPTKSITL